MKGRKGRAGLKGQLIDKSIDAYVLALETINRLSIKYRVESFAHLICNAWELLLKARVVDASKSRRVIYYKRKRNEPRRTLSLRDVLSKVIPDNKDAIRRNLETVAELRDEATHYVISEVPREVVLLFQACVINYHKKLTEWFDISLSDRVSVGMMTIVYDHSPETFDPASASLRRRLGKDVTEYLASFQTKIRQEFEDLKKSSEYSIGIEYKLVLTKKPDEADIFPRKLNNTDHILTTFAQYFYMSMLHGQNIFLDKTKNLYLCKNKKNIRLQIMETQFCYCFGL